MTQAEFLPALNYTPPVISINFEALEQRISEITETYTNLLVQEDDVPAIKNEMAALNKIVAGLAEARKDAVAKVSIPIKEFEDKVKALEAKVKETRSFLDEQVQAHVQREREGRRASVKFIVEFQKDDHGCADLDIPIQERWLNKTTTDKTITAEVQAIILAHKKAEEEKAALEMAKQDRIVALENHSKAMGQERGYTLSFSRFTHLQFLNIPLVEALAGVAKIYEVEDDMRAAEAAAVQAPAPKAPAHFMDMPEEPAVHDAEVHEVQKSMTITAVYDAKNGPAISALYQKLKPLCVSCTAKVKELEYA